MSSQVMADETKRLEPQDSPVIAEKLYYFI